MHKRPRSALIHIYAHGGFAYRAGLPHTPRMSKRDISAELGAAISAARLRAGLRQVDVAKRLRKNRSWVAHIERGERRVTVIGLIALADVIGFDAAAMVRRFRHSRR
jgi:ribosome-binding protein aMBF1 (putative translation factor)